ncbi:hypothetical protein BDV39DRAFT_183136 [Aspergillus sergii]|uniref:Uncharacterized protein n=1 Tax=Aspergillus sergii TaxID=1034303 RepID=A0A5N6WQX3_9EURO|nr:hypothetical protein BDV39DRAFT_183136 [Aspergillus sergii]
MRFSSNLITIILNFLSTLCQQTLGRLPPIDINRFSIFHQRTVMDDSQNASCPMDPSLSTTERTVFTTRGCVVYGYPSTGGVLRKEADLLDMLFYRSPALMYRSAHPIWTKKTDSVIS